MKNQTLKHGNSTNLLEEMVKCSQAKNDPCFIENLQENYNLLRKKKLALNKEESEEDEKKSSDEDIFEQNKKLANEMVPLTNLLEKTVIQRNQKTLCEVCRKNLKRKSIAGDESNIPIPIKKRFSMKDMRDEETTTFSSKKYNKKRASCQTNKQRQFSGKERLEANENLDREAMFYKILEEKIHEILVAPYNNIEAMSQKKSCGSGNNIITKVKYDSHSNQASLYQINEEEDQAYLSKDENGTKEDPKNKLEFLRKTSKLEILKLLNKENTEVSVNKNESSEVTEDKPQHSNNRNYAILRQMSFYKDIQKAPNEIDNFFNDLYELKGSSSLLGEIEFLQDILMSNLENMYRFVDNFTDYFTKKLVLSGETAKARDLLSKKPYLDQKKLMLQKTLRMNKSNQNLHNNQDLKTYDIPGMNSSKEVVKSQKSNEMKTEKLNKLKISKYDIARLKSQSPGLPKEDDVLIMEKGFTISKVSHLEESSKKCIINNRRSDTQLPARKISDHRRLTSPIKTNMFNKTQSQTDVPFEFRRESDIDQNNFRLKKLYKKDSFDTNLKTYDDYNVYAGEMYLSENHLQQHVIENSQHREIMNAIKRDKMSVLKQIFSTSDEKGMSGQPNNLHTINSELKLAKGGLRKGSYNTNSNKSFGKSNGNPVCGHQNLFIVKDHVTGEHNEQKQVLPKVVLQYLEDSFDDKSKAKSQFPTLSDSKKFKLSDCVKFNGARPKNHLT